METETPECSGPIGGLFIPMCHRQRQSLQLFLPLTLVAILLLYVHRGEVALTAQTSQLLLLIYLQDFGLVMFRTALQATLLSRRRLPTEY
ncbi:hypothetical protein F5J12DRAFT_817445 [Pisolithus orientalis]|uniref:uncharacterized protein n=1 Tax=Pisolithus orientalis TaxID=936130 RepID=UPI0022242246|nr:uncharacterized protein F5J12DRAFT_817445 [Pisolithus orientalis]KAI6015315.1 hypothetical protein F5J12DRAFT_817445 [Pisolithus orientalis]